MSVNCLFNKLIFQRDWLFVCQVDIATVTKLNSSVIDVSDEVPWNHGEISLVSHYLFAGKKLGSGGYTLIDSLNLVLQDWRTLHCTDEETEA